MWAGLTLHLGEPRGLAVVLGGAGHRVEEHQQQDQPVEVVGLHGHATVLPHGVVQLAQLVAGQRDKTRGDSPGEGLEW